MIGKHYFYFGDRLSKKMDQNRLDQSNWEILRNDNVDGPFALEKSKEQYEENCRKSVSYRETAEVIAAKLKEKQCGKIVSCGVGKGILEWHLKELLPSCIVKCTDYTSEAIEKLKTVFEKCDEAMCFDMCNGDYSIFKDCDYLIMYRVSTEFDMPTWKKIFAEMKKAGIKRVIYVPTELATYRQIRNGTWQHIKNKIRKRKDTFCGWLYSVDEFDRMWDGMYTIDETTAYADTKIYFLEKI
jgi:hypothetical protein